MARLSDIKSKVAGLIAYHAPGEKASIQRMAAHCLRDAGWSCVAVPVLRPALGRLAAYAAAPTVARRASMLVSLGGDGTLLGAAHLAAPFGKPVLGVNLGGLGFMTAVSPERLDSQLSQLLAGRCRMEERRMIRAHIVRKGRRASHVDALNDVSVARVGAGRLVQLDASVDGRFLASFRVDGLVFSTPTGSTAYSLSLGGPVVDAQAPVFLLSLIAPHTLSSRPLALQDSRVLEVQVPADGMELSADGKRPVALRAGDRVRLEVSPFRASLVLPPAHDPWAVLRNKLGWQGHRPGRGGHRA